MLPCDVKADDGWLGLECDVVGADNDDDSCCSISAGSKDVRR